jgi:hypothetical protein
MRVLVACEYSGVVRDAFIRAGHNAVSCDLLPTDSPGPHIQGNVLNLLGDRWDLMIAHPPCTYLANSGVKWLYKGGKGDNGRDPERWAKMEAGAEFFRALQSAPIPRICTENPIVHGYAKKIVGQQSQTVQPWQFGHGEVKATCLWLKGLPLLTPTDIVEGREARVHKLGPSADRWKLRSTTYTGIASAMAAQFS